MADNMEYAERSWESRDGLALFARDYPAAAGPARLPVICLHGLSRNSKDFEEAAPAIAKLGRRVVVPDVRGRGRSDRDPNAMNYHPRTYARDLLELMDALGIARAVFVGTSMGGFITMAVALMRSKAVAAAVLNEAGPAISAAGLVRITGYVGQAAVIGDWSDAAAYVKQTNGVVFPDFEDSDWQAFARRTFREGADGKPELDYDPDISKPFAATKIKSESWLSWLLYRRLARKRPTLLIRGELSDLLTAEIARRMQRTAPTLGVVEVPRVGHAPMLSEPAARQGLESFLAALP